MRDRVLFLLCCLAAACGGTAEPPAGGVPTFTRDIAPILYAHCSNCHRPGESAPFVLLTYKDAERRARQIVEVTGDRFMPPWLPSEENRAFVDARGLDREQIESFRRWYEGGSPEGDPAELPPMPEWTAGWQLGEPDLVIEPGEEYVLPADGVDVFRNLIIPIPNERTRYVRTIDLRPGNPKIVHHAVMRVDRSRSSRLLDQQDPGPGYDGMEWGEAKAPEGHFLGWTPGRIPYAGSDALAWVLEPGSDLVLQLHMLPTGKPEPILPRVGLYFSETPPTRSMEIVVLDVKQIDIPAGEREYVVEESYELPVDLEVISVYPHAHYLGRLLEGWAELPDGTRETLIHIADWDFNWQDQYRYAEPLRLPAGSRIGLHYSYDNSSDNPRNPNNPPRRVISGNRSEDEMGSLSLEVILAHEDDGPKLKEALWKQDLERHPRYWIAHGLLGSLLLEQGRLQEAGQYLAQAVKLNPDYAVGFNNLGAVMSLIGRKSHAVANFRRALELRPGYANAHYNLGLELAALGQVDEAIAHYRRALDVRSHDADFHNNLGVALAMQGRLDEAVGHFRRAVELNPDSVEAKTNLATALGN